MFQSRSRSSPQARAPHRAVARAVSASLLQLDRPACSSTQYTKSGVHCTASHASCASRTWLSDKKQAYIRPYKQRYNNGTFKLVPIFGSERGLRSRISKTICPPLVGRAARLRPPSRAIDTIVQFGSRDGGLVRPRVLYECTACELGCRPKSGGASNISRQHRVRLRQVVGPQSSTRARICAQESPCSEADRGCQRCAHPSADAANNSRVHAARSPKATSCPLVIPLPFHLQKAASGRNTSRRDCACVPECRAKGRERIPSTMHFGALMNTSWTKRYTHLTVAAFEAPRPGCIAHPVLPLHRGRLDNILPLTGRLPPPRHTRLWNTRILATGATAQLTG